MNAKYMKKEIEKKNDKVQCQLFSVASSKEAHLQGKVFLRTLMTTLKRI